MKRLLLLCIALFAVTTWPLSVVAKERRPLTLREAMETALLNNLGIQLTKEEHQHADGKVIAAKSRFDTELAARLETDNRDTTSPEDGISVDEDNLAGEIAVKKRFTTGTELVINAYTNRFETDNAVITPSYTTGISLTVEQPLVKGWGKTIQTAATRAAEKDREAASYNVDTYAADLAAEVRKTYWELVFAWQELEVSRFSHRLAVKLLNQTEASIKVGRMSQIDRYQPQSEVTRREEELIGAERAIGSVEDKLKQLMNSDSWSNTFEPIDKPDTSPVTPDRETIYNSCLANRADLKAALLNTDAAAIREALAEDDGKPELNLFGRLEYGGFGSNYSKAASSIADDPDTCWQVGVQLSFPLENRLAKGNLMQARAERSKTQLAVNQLHLDIRESISTTIRDIELAIKAQDATQKTTLAARKQLEAEQAKFSAGKATTLDVLIAQEAYVRALSQKNRTDMVYARSLAELDRIQGLINVPDS